MFSFRERIQVMHGMCNETILFFSQHLGLVQQKLWHYMLSRVHHNILTHATHAISLSSLMGHLANTKDTSSIKQKLLAIKHQKTKLSYFFTDIAIAQNIVYFEYPEHLRSYLAHQRVHIISKKLTEIPFKSKYALYLYELFLHINQAQQPHEITVEELRNYMGLCPTEYASIKSLKHHILQKSIDQISELTRLHIGLTLNTQIAQPSFTFTIHSPIDTVLQLKQIHGTYLADKAYSLYSALPHQVKQKLDQEYDLWIIQIHDYHTHMLHDQIKRAFLIQKLVSPLEQDFELWSLANGYQ